MLVTLTLLTALLARSQITAQRLSDDRAAVRLAETALLTLRAGGALPADASVSIAALDDPSPVGSLRWTSITATINGRRATLVGLLPTTRPAVEGKP